jgi:hypothetical protein
MRLIPSIYPQRYPQLATTAHRDCPHVIHRPARLLKAVNDMHHQLVPSPSATDDPIRRSSPLGAHARIRCRRTSTEASQYQLCPATPSCGLASRRRRPARPRALARPRRRGSRPGTAFSSKVLLQATRHEDRASGDRSSAHTPRALARPHPAGVVASTDFRDRRHL